MQRELNVRIRAIRHRTGVYRWVLIRAIILGRAYLVAQKQIVLNVRSRKIRPGGEKNRRPKSAHAMDLLHKAYSTGDASDDDVEDGNEGRQRQGLHRPPPKRLKPDNSFPFARPEHPSYPPTRLCSVPRPNQSLDLQNEAPAPGRYISKRERALFGPGTRIPDLNPNPAATTPSPGTLSRSTF